MQVTTLKIVTIKMQNDRKIKIHGIKIVLPSRIQRVDQNAGMTYRSPEKIIDSKVPFTVGMVGDISSFPAGDRRISKPSTVWMRLLSMICCGLKHALRSQLLKCPHNCPLLWLRPRRGKQKKKTSNSHTRWFVVGFVTKSSGIRMYESSEI